MGQAWRTPRKHMGTLVYLDSVTKPQRLGNFDSTNSSLNSYLVKSGLPSFAGLVTVSALSDLRSTGELHARPAPSCDALKVSQIYPNGTLQFLKSLLTRAA